MKRYLTATLALLLVLTGPPVCAQGTDSPPAEDIAADLTPPSQWTIAVLSPGNHTDIPEAYALTASLVEKYLRKRELNLITSKDLRPTLRRNRIRSTGELSSGDAELLAANTDANMFLLTSINFYRSGDNPEFGLSLRLVRPGDMQIISAVSHSSVGIDHIGLFGVGQIKDINILAEKTIDEAVDQLFKNVEKRLKASTTDTPKLKVAVIRYDNLSKFRKAGDIVSDWTISTLVNDGYFVLEPGVVSEITTLIGDLPVGGIDMAQLAELNSKLNIDYVVTGQVDLLRPAQGTSSRSAPACEFSARLVDAGATQIKATFHCEANGNDSRSVFGLGRIHSVGKLLEKQLSKMVESFEDQEIQL